MHAYQVRRACANVETGICMCVCLCIYIHIARYSRRETDGMADHVVGFFFRDMEESRVSRFFFSAFVNAGRRGLEVLFFQVGRTLDGIIIY